jgi:hypothetical protein
MTDLTAESDAPRLGFPFIFVDIIKEVIEEWLPEHQVANRPLRHTDSAASIGVFPASWAEQPNSKEIGRIEGAENRYVIKIQVMRKAMDEEDGRALFSNDAKLVRVILYRDPNLPVRLGGLQETIMGTKEMVQRFGAARQDFNQSELAGAFTFVSTTDYIIDTSIT